MDGFELIRRVRAGPEAVRRRRSSWSAPTPIPTTPDRIAAAGRGRIFPETIFSGAGAPETGADPQWHDSIRSSFPRCAGALASVARWRADRRRDLARILERLDRWSRRIASCPNRCGTLTERLRRAPADGRPTPAAPPARPRKSGSNRGAPHRRAGADQGGSVAEVSDPADRDGAVQRVHELQAERRRGLPGGGRAHRPGPRRRHRAATIIGLEFPDPAAVWGGKVHGSVYMDFFAGANNNAFRVRTASIEIDWKTRSDRGRPGEADLQSARAEFAGAGGHLAADRRRQSVALAAAGARRAGFAASRASTGCARRSAWCRRAKSARTRARVDAGSRRGPALEGRFNFFHNLDDERRMEIAVGLPHQHDARGRRLDPLQPVLAGLVLQSVEAGGVHRRLLLRDQRGAPGQRHPAGLRRVRELRRTASTASADGDRSRSTPRRAWTCTSSPGRRTTPNQHLIDGRDRQESAVRRQRLLPPGAERAAGARSDASAHHVHWAGTANQQPL